MNRSSAIKIIYIYFMTSKYKYCCETCAYNTNISQNYTNHINSARHTKFTTLNEKISCEWCNKPYYTNRGLQKHKQKCKNPNENITIEQMDGIAKNNKLLEEIIMQLQNTNDSRNTITTNIADQINTNSHNTNNINIFLNEQCKDAINFIEFKNRLEVMEKHFELLCQKGYFAGYTEIMNHNLSKYTIEQRPLHCIKDDDDKSNDQIQIRHNKQWVYETRDCCDLLDTIVREIDLKILHRFNEHESQNGNMQNGDIVQDKLRFFWKIKNKIINKLLQMTTIDKETMEKYISELHSESIAQKT